MSEVEVDLSIIVVNWNTREYLAQCLDSINTHVTLAGSPSVETIVVDNASIDGSQAMVKEQYPWVRLIENTENVGFARANNQAMRESRGKAVLLLNSDAVLLDQTLPRLLRSMESMPDIGVCGPMLLNPDLTFQSSYASFPTLGSELLHQFSLAPFLWGSSYPSHPQEVSRVEQAVDWVGGACFLVRQATIQDVGLLDEAYEMYGEELDWCRRIKNRGWKVMYCPDAQAVHHGGKSSSHQPLWKLMRIHRSKKHYFSKFYGRLAGIVVEVIIKLSCLTKAIYLVVTSGLRLRQPVDKDWKMYWKVVWTRL